ncbi:hypothetical protein [Nocardia sp. NPDC049526]|uniref:hypothetical protein n=1 Tax=Nocardia sp. NPDC049526 TaxID=3364316 RepID=UPI0037BCF796
MEFFEIVRTISAACPSTGVAAPALGAAQGAYVAFVERMRERTVAVRLARAASEIDAAILQMDRNLSEELRYAEAGEDIPLELRLRARRDQVRATERAMDAVEMSTRIAGGRSARTPGVLERHWRDVHTADRPASGQRRRARAGELRPWRTRHGRGRPDSLSGRRRPAPVAVDRGSTA